MRTRSVLAGAVAASCLLAACGSSHAVNTLGTTSTTGAKGAAASGSATTAKAGAGSATTARAAASSSSASAAGSSPASSSSTAKAGALGAVGTVEVDVARTSLGQVLVDAEGRTLYLYKKDTPGKASTCDGSCAVTWPPVEVKDKASAGTGIDAAKLTTIKRVDGTEQVAYDGWPLYRYDGDKNAGDTSGQGVSSVWYAVSPAGTPISA
ncbi:MAG: hypothetical protein OEY41_04835 [Acidimicrobiia bacterium]|nr:hypothetical protein [Acidimicrobiia bacterium]MDH4362501.1 hypothetical protein [Acidimicrobiia bacterium]MDH5289307.1 hypothetical protein [Acidimicrobiia bacterium]